MADEPPRTIGPWPVIRKLGEGGQGTVYLVRSPTRQQELDTALHNVVTSLQKQSAAIAETDDRLQIARELVQHLATCSRDDRPNELGAGKVYMIPDGPFAEKALSRLVTECDVLQSLTSHHIIRVKYCDVNSRLMIADYHPRGTLTDHPDRYAGAALAGLVAVRGIVSAVAMLHEKSVVHRDIKPANVLIAEDGHLVLGDFGIVFTEREDRHRLTDTFERVGSRDWMPPWAHTGARIDDVTPSFDVFSLGKLIWSMLSGQLVLPYWYWAKERYNLCELFPASSHMAMVNQEILSSSIVEEERSCLTDGGQLLARVDAVIEALEAGGSVVGNETMTCKVCGRDHYKILYGEELRTLVVPSRDSTERMSTFHDLLRSNRVLTVQVARCGYCGNLALFNFPDGDALPAWQS